MQINKRREDFETNFNSDESDRDWPLPEVNSYECCKKRLYFEQCDIPMLNTIFSMIDKLFQSI